MRAKASCVKKPKKIVCGDCYRFAVQEAQQPYEVTVVHGTVTDPWSGKRFSHAWVERDDKAYDWQMVHIRDQKPQPIDDYYRIWKPKDMTRYPGVKSVVMMARHGHFGPWK